MKNSIKLLEVIALKTRRATLYIDQNVKISMPHAVGIQDDTVHVTAAQSCY